MHTWLGLSQQRFLNEGRPAFQLSFGIAGGLKKVVPSHSSTWATPRWSCQVEWKQQRLRSGECWRLAPTRQDSPQSTIPILPSRPLLLDDRVLVALLVGERLPISKRSERFTTMYFYFRACRAVVAGVGGHLAGPFDRLDRDRRNAALEQMLTLPDDVGLPDSRELVPIMAGVCHLPATWDQLAAGFASGMGPPPLPVMGPP
jgi:hypothetical protein